MNFTIYALLCPVSKNVRYIGYTSVSLEQRLSYHYYDISKGVQSHKVNFLKQLLPDKVEIVPIEQGLPDIDTAIKREVFWISQYSDLTNATTGGEKNKVYREDVVKKMSEARKGKCVGVDNPMYGKKRPDVSARNKIVNPESGKKTGETLRRMYSTPEYKKIHQETQQNRIRLKSIDLNGNIKFYNSAREAARDGFDRKCINLCISGKYKQHKGLVWQVA